MNSRSGYSKKPIDLNTPMFNVLGNAISEEKHPHIIRGHSQDLIVFQREVARIVYEKIPVRLPDQMRNNLDGPFVTIDRGDPQKGAQVIIPLGDLLVTRGRKKEQINR
jgi:hypothetical protein